MTKRDANGKPLAIGDRVHVKGRADKVMYVAELNDKTAGLAFETGGKASFDMLYARIVKFKKQDRKTQI
jgi:hypothetical protein